MKKKNSSAPNSSQPAVKKKSSFKKLLSMTFKKRLKSNVSEVLQFSEYADNPLLEQKRSSDLEKIHFIVGHGITREQLR